MFPVRRVTRVPDGAARALPAGSPRRTARSPRSPSPSRTPAPSFRRVRATARRSGRGTSSRREVLRHDGGIADLTIVFASSTRRSCVLVERDDGVDAGRKERRLGLRAGYTGSLVLDEARGSPPTAARRGGRRPRSRWTSSRTRGRRSPAGRRLARAAFEYATAYAREREAFGEPIVDAQGSRSSSRHGDGDRGRGSSSSGPARRSTRGGRRTCSAPTRRRSRATPRCGDDGRRADLGRAGIMRDHPVEKWLRDAKVVQIVEGTSEIQRRRDNRTSTRATCVRTREAPRPALRGAIGQIRVRSTGACRRCGAPSSLAAASRSCSPCSCRRGVVYAARRGRPRGSRSRASTSAASRRRGRRAALDASAAAQVRRRAS